MGTSTKLSFALLSIGLAACADDRARPNGGGTVETGFDRHGLYVANTDHGSIARIDLRESDLKIYETGREPTRIARSGNRIYVTNRGERTVSVFEDDGGELSAVGTIATGAEPFGVVANEERAYVTASMEGRVIEYDAASLEEIRSWDVAGEPRGLAMHTSGAAIYVASTFGGKLTYIDLDDGTAHELELPNVSGFNFNTGVEFNFARRITGDPAVSPNGDMLAIPSLYVDRETVIPDEANPNEIPGSGGYGGRFNPAVVVVDLNTDNGEPDIDSAIPFTATGFINDIEHGFFRSASGYPASISFTPDQEIALVAIEGADVVLALDLTQIDPHTANKRAADGALGPGFGHPGGVGLSFLPMVTVVTAAGPDGVAVLSDDVAYVHALFDHRAQRIDLESVRRMLHPENGEIPFGPGVGSLSDPQLRATSDIKLGDEVLPPEIERGRRLFFASSNSMMSGEGSSVSCATCHFQGRTDGFSWVFERGLRQTPSLAGVVSRYEPVGWTGDRPTVAEDAMMTSQGLMGGQGLTDRDAEDIAAFVDYTREIDNPLAGSNDERIVRGAEIFARPEVACLSCHQGAGYTNNQNVSLFGMETVKVRPLNGIRATGPYLHDGSAATLLDVLERVRDGSMGNTSSLTDQEMEDLEFYLMSL